MTTQPGKRARAGQPGAEGFVPESVELDDLRAAAEACEGCGLFRDAERVVFGDGARNADLMLVGEQPGDAEDRAGEPFVGPAGRLLGEALSAAGIDRSTVYETNAVKHFKFVRAERGKRRLHKKPARSEIVACRPWLLAELRAVRPVLAVLLGATAAQSLLGPEFRVGEHRGEVVDLPPEAPGRGVVTVHPSAVLRDPNRDRAFDAFVADLRVAARER